MQYKYDDYDYYSEHETISIKEKLEILEQIAKEEYEYYHDKCA